MEIKTCEHFVVNRLMELENLTEKLKEECLIQNNIIADLIGKLEYVGTFLSIARAYGSTEKNKNDYYVKFKDVWFKYDKEDYEQLREIFDLPEPRELEEED